ncbi:MAG: hypothetical protein ACYC5H_07265 [Methylovirgula sp.]
MSADHSSSASLALNEGKCCDAVIRTLEARFGQPRNDLHSPEKDHAAAPVEFTCRIGGRLYAFEHTGIEPFAGHIRLHADAARDLDPIKQALAGRLPPDEFFELHMPALAMQGLKAPARQRIQAALAAWVESTAPTLPRTEIRRDTRPITKATPSGVPFEVSLRRCVRQPQFSVSFSIVHVVSDSRQPEDRKARLRKTCVKKFPKLAAWKRDSGARTVLVLEDNDIQLSNPQVIYDAYSAVEDEFSDRPDEVHLVTTIIEPTWWVHRLRVDDLNYYQLSQLGNCMTELDSATLRDLMAEC